MERSTTIRTRGFASMNPAQQREIASKGGKAAHKKGTAHQFTSESAKIAGRKGGKVSRRPRESIRKDLDSLGF
jgi:general stress protein YciG